MGKQTERRHGNRNPKKNSTEFSEIPMRVFWQGKYRHRESELKSFRRYGRHNRFVTLADEEPVPALIPVSAPCCSASTSTSQLRQYRNITQRNVQCNEVSSTNTFEVDVDLTGEDDTAAAEALEVQRRTRQAIIEIETQMNEIMRGAQLKALRFRYQIRKIKNDIQGDSSDEE